MGVWIKERNRGKFLHFDPIEGMNNEPAKELIKKMNKVDRRNFVGNKKEVKGPRQGNSYDCGIYVILMMEKIIKNVKEGRNIELMKINQEEADRKRSKIRERLKEENTIVNENEKNVKKQREIKENEEYFTKLNLKILNYSKLDTITLDNEIVKENG